jgi:hypothetical protein
MLQNAVAERLVTMEHALNIHVYPNAEAYRADVPHQLIARDVLRGSGFVARGATAGALSQGDTDPFLIQFGGMTP